MREIGKKSKGVVAYVLMVTEIGKEHEIISQLLKIKGVTEARTVYGEFDVIVIVEADNMKNLDDYITRVRKMPQLIRTVTLISA
ncbi:MAG TPA: Lrp/AsnC ligand binding domain-containing protein [archaeon]|nr:Lrp/AsnC ligand binding domain-containing protein [archaeon]